MRLVVDANILVGELLRKRGRVLVADPRLELFNTARAWNEAQYSILGGHDPNQEAAASLLGARPRQVFWWVTLPRLMPGIVSATLIVFAFNFGAFEVPLILGGRPNTLPVEAWRAFSDPDVERRFYGAAIVVVVCTLLGALLYLYLLLYRWLERVLENVKTV